MATPIYFPRHPKPEEERAFVAYLRYLYTDSANSPVSYAGPTKILDAIRRENKYINIGMIRLKRYLSQFSGYSLFKPRRISKQTRRYVSERVGHSVEIDLMSLARFAKYNNNVSWLLVCIDIFSRFVWVTALEDKRALTVVKALDAMFKTMKFFPQKIHSDLGSENTSAVMRNYLKKNHIQQTFAMQSTHGARVERIIGSLRGLFRRYREQNNTYSFVKAIPDLVRSYNSRIHSSIGVPPMSVNAYNSGYIADFEYRNWVDRVDKPYEYSLHSLVRIALQKNVIGDKYDTPFSEQIYEIFFRGRSDHVNIYRVQSCDKSEVLGTFYAAELSPVDGKEAIYHIDNFIREEVRGRGRNKEVFVLVSWKGFPNKQCNSWIKKSSVVSV